ncbi:MAG: DNA-processing protein DprA [Bdellovibrionales bacterium]|nr:DNA-processing protein DprA [Bdellovibrionales bacterium]
MPPRALYVEGSASALALLGRLPERGLSVVGSRDPLPRTIQLVRSWITEISRRKNLIIVSGLARGADSAAHEAAIASGLPTIAILGTPLNDSLGAQREALRARILAAGGLVISERKDGERTQAWHFRQRNRFLGACVRAVLVVEAAESSGTLNTARWAFDHHVPVFASPCVPGDPRLAGNQKLLDERCAQPFWGPHNLDFAWFEFKRGSELVYGAAADTPEARLLAQAAALTQERGGFALAELVDRALAAGWQPGPLFEWVEARLDDGLLLRSGALLSARRA